MVAVTKRQILRSCKARGWTVQPAALEGILSSCRHSSNKNPNSNDDDDGDDVLAQLLDRIADAINGGRTVTAELWNELVADEEGDDDEDAHHHLQHRTKKVMGQHQQNRHKNKTKKQQLASAAPSFEIVSAFETPKLVYQVMRKQFQVVQEDWPLWGTAEDKIRMLSDRYNLIHQRVLRHELFRPSGLHHHHHSGGGGQHQLTPIESLLGKSGGGGGGHGHRQHKLVLVLGVLLQLQEGVYCLEDPTGQVPVQLQHCTVTDHAYVTEHSILIVEGHFQDGVLTVHRMGQPLQESRASALAAIQKQVAHPHYTSNHHRRRRQLQPFFRVDDSQPSFLIVSDVPMDLPRVSQQWEALLTSYENKLARRGRRLHETTSTAALPLFVVLGPFHSGPAVRQQQQGVDELLSLVARFPRVAAQCHFCFVPAVDDISVLPWRQNPHYSSSSSHKKAVPNCHFASNPCRIRWAGREMVVFRYDLLPLLQQHSMALPVAAPPSSASQDSNDDDDDLSLQQQQQEHPYSRLLQTVLNQGHLVPVAGTPIYWNYNHALSLYPMPDCLVLSGGGGGHRGECYTERYYDCRVLIPGSLAERGTYALYQPDCEADDDDDVSSDDSSGSSSSDEEMLESSAAVKFGTLLAGEE